jgi:hypothetical protein
MLVLQKYTKFHASASLHGLDSHGCCKTLHPSTCVKICKIVIYTRIVVIAIGRVINFDEYISNIIEDESAYRDGHLHDI